MIFECPNCALCCVASMKTKRDKLEANVFIHHVLLKDLQCFVVKLLEFGLEPAGFQERNYALIRRQNDFFGAILHGFRVNEVAVEVVNDENVRVSTDGRNKETAGRVRVDLAGGGLAVGVQKMCFGSRWFRS
jgi:hypothetical protein